MDIYSSLYPMYACLFFIFARNLFRILYHTETKINRGSTKKAKLEEASVRDFITKLLLRCLPSSLMSAKYAFVNSHGIRIAQTTIRLSDLAFQ